MDVAQTGDGTAIPQTAVFDTVAKPTRWPPDPVGRRGPEFAFRDQRPGALRAWGKRQAFWHTAAHPPIAACGTPPACAKGMAKSTCLNLRADRGFATVGTP